MRLDKKDPKKESVISKGNILLDVKSFSARIDDQPVQLRKKEFDLLHMLMLNENIVLTREEILDKVWGYDYVGDARAVDSVIKSLRKHMHVDYIQTIVGVGYKFVVKEH